MRRLLRNRIRVSGEGGREEGDRQTDRAESQRDRETDRPSESQRDRVRDRQRMTVKVRGRERKRARVVVVSVGLHFYFGTVPLKRRIHIAGFPLVTHLLVSCKPLVCHTSVPGLADLSQRIRPTFTYPGMDLAAFADTAAARHKSLQQ